MAVKTITELKTEVNTTINTNGTRSITGATLNTALIDTIDSLSAVDESLEERKANIDGSYDTMTVGLAKNLEGDIYVEGKTYFKPTATVISDDDEFTSEEVGSGPASIEAIQGNTVMWNQMCNDSEITPVVGGINGSQFAWPIPKDHKIYISCMVKLSSDYTGGDSSVKKIDLAQGGNTYGGVLYFNSVPADNTYHQISGIVINVSSANNSIYYRTGNPSSGSVSFKNTQVIDLTQMFGAGNEPTIAEFKNWLAKNIGLSTYYACNPGELINSKPTGMAGIGYNLMSLSGSTGTARIPGKYDDGLYGSYYGIAGNHSNITFTDAITGVTTSITPDEEDKFELTKPGTITVSGADSTTTVFMWYDGSYTEANIPYEKVETSGLDVTKIYGKPNGGNTYEQVFSSGLKSFGENRDILDLRNDEATVGVGRVDNLGAYTWTKQGTLYTCPTTDFDVTGFVTGDLEMPRGKAVVWNQLTVTGGTGTTDGISERSYALNGSITEQQVRSIQGNVIKNHLFLFFFYIKASEALDCSISVTDSLMDKIDVAVTTNYTRVSSRKYITRGTAIPTSGIMLTPKTASNATIFTKNCMRFDLTAMFGAGNEPTVAEFISIFTASSYTYNTGSLGIVNNGNYATAAAFKTAMTNVPMQYKLADPIHYTDLIASNDGGQTGTPVQVFNYTVDNWGLEELIPQNNYAATNGMVTSAPILNVKYSIDAVEAINTLNDEIADLYESKANTEGYYPELSVGLADNLKGKDVVTEEFFVRTSGGEGEVANGTASLDGVKGNSVKWNQLIQNGDFAINDLSMWSTKYPGLEVNVVTANISESVLTISRIPETTTSSGYGLQLNYKPLPNHKYYVSCFGKANNEDSFAEIGVYDTSYNNVSVSRTLSLSFQRLSKILQNNSSSNNIFGLKCGYLTSPQNTSASFKNVYIIDITAMGIDNLTTTDDIEAWLAENLGTQSYYPYSAGTITNVNTTGLESTGFNLLDPETYTAKIPGIYTEDYDNYYGIVGTYTGVTFTPAATGIAESITSDIDEEGKVLIEEPGTIAVVGGDSTSCVFLWWDGSQTESEPYVEPSVARIDVNHIKGVAVGGSSTEAETIFPNGMCGVGDIKDEIFVEDGVAKAVKRVGVVNMGNLSWASVAYSVFRAVLSDAPSQSSMNATTDCKYLLIPPTSDQFTGFDKTYRIVYVSGDKTYIYLKDTDFEASATGANNLRLSLNNYSLYYELATPIIYTSLQYESSSYFSNGTAVELPINYTVNNWGLERILPANTTSAILTAKPTLTCEYATDVLETINTINDEIDNINARFDDKADKVGAYPELIAGNLVDDTPSTGMFTYRKAGGDKSIASGTAIIDKISGKTLVWNQMVQNGNFANGTTNWTTYNCSISAANNELTITATSNTFYINQENVNIINGHKYYLGYTFQLTNAAQNSIHRDLQFSDSNDRFGVVVGITSIYDSTDVKRIHKILTASGSGSTTCRFVRAYNTWAVGDIIKVKDIIFIDLTQMFGAGNEPTVDEFEALYPFSYYNYTATPQPISVTASGIKTTGFNQWDEQWELGAFDTTTGVNKTGQANQIRSKNLIPIFPNTEYYFPWNFLWVIFYNANKEVVTAFVTGASDTNGNSSMLSKGSFTTPDGVHYMKFYTTNNYAPTYNHNICINLSDTAKNGTYEPYEEHTLYFNGEDGSLATVTGVASGSSTSGVIFPEGLRNINNISDEITRNSAIKRVNIINLGDLSWTLEDGRFLSTNISPYGVYRGSQTSNTSNAKITSGKYSLGSLYNIYDKINNRFAVGLVGASMIGPSTGTGRIYIVDTSYSTPADFKTAMNGVYLIYEIATPITYTLDTPIPTTYYVNGDGTEQRIPEDNTSNITAPIILTTRYSMDAVGTLNGLPTGYISESSMDAFLAEFASKIGAAINKTITATKTFDAATNKYNFTITVTNPS